MRPLFLLLVLIFLVSSLNSCTSIFFYPDRHFYGSPQDLSLPYEQIEIITPGNPKLIAWFIPAQQTPSKALVIHLHGNAQNMSSHFRGVSWLAHEGYDLLLLDPRGYGASEGTAHLPGVLDDVHRTFRYAFRTYAQTNNHFILFGQSIGATLALHAAAEEEFRGKFRAVIAESPFGSYRQIFREKVGDFWLLYPFQWPLSLLVPDELSPLSRVNLVSPTPALFLLAENDRIVPARHTKTLFQSAQEPKTLWTFYGVRHLEIFRNASNRKKLVGWLNNQLP